MKKAYSLLFLLIGSITISYGQNFVGKAIYKTHSKASFSFGDKKDNNSKLHKELEEKIKKMFQKEYELTFTNTESVYKQTEKLSVPNPKADKNMIVIGASSPGLLYKNIKENRFSEKKNIMGKVFLVKDTIAKVNWQLSNETKNIGVYTCYKATFTEEFIDKGSVLINSDESHPAKKMVTTTAWYTPQIPVSNGPENFGGLPGLILEVNSGGKTIVCSEIILNPDEKIVIQEPEKGKEVSQEEFEVIKLKKAKEMIERSKGNKEYFNLQVN